MCKCHNVAYATISHSSHQSRPVSARSGECESSFLQIIFRGFIQCSSVFAHAITSLLKIVIACDNSSVILVSTVGLVVGRSATLQAGHDTTANRTAGLVSPTQFDVQNVSAQVPPLRTARKFNRLTPCAVKALVASCPRPKAGQTEQLEQVAGRMRTRPAV
jgi:hypothetical protein